MAVLFKLELKALSLSLPTTVSMVTLEKYGSEYTKRIFFSEGISLLQMDPNSKCISILYKLRKVSCEISPDNLCSNQLIFHHS